MIHEYIHKVKYYECDRMGITHHSNYIRFMEEARVDFLDRMGYGFEKIEADGIVSPVIEVQCRYKQSTTFQDEIRIEIRLSKVTAVKFTFSYIGRKDGSVVFEGESTHCFTQNGRPVRLAERYPQLFATEHID